MTLFLVIFAVMFLVVAIMSVGVLMGRKPISGSCGGMSALGMEVACDICGGDTSKCDKENAEGAEEGRKSVDMTYDATKN